MKNNKNSHIEKMKKYLNSINLTLNKIEKNIDKSSDYDMIEKLIHALDILNIRINNMESFFIHDDKSQYIENIINKDNKIMNEIDKLISC